jgi:regulatory protein
MSEDTLFKTALSKAMALCSHRELCSFEIRNKLQSWGIENKDADKITDILTEENFINELRYSKAFVNDKFKYNKWGRIKIASHLRAKGISAGTVKAALEEINNETYLQMIKTLIASHRKTIKSKDKYDMKAKLLRYGLSKGFESYILYEILGESEE